jgi:FAD/FMN-containing dehydrogenase
MTNTLTGRLASIVGDAHVSTDPDVLAGRSVDHTGRYRGHAAALVRPATAEQVAKTLRACRDAGAYVTIQGGRTSLVAGTVPEHDDVLLSTERLTAIADLDTADRRVRAGAGATAAAVQQAAARAGLLFGVDLAARDSASVGGMASTNAGGLRTVRYGNMGEQVMGLEVALPDGSLVRRHSRVRRDNTGYDLAALFVGAEGTLGVITAAVLKLFPLPRDRATSFVAVRDPQAAIELLGMARRLSGDTVTSFELINRTTLEFVLRHMNGSIDPLAEPSPWYVLIELSSSRVDADLGSALEACLGSAVECGLVLDAAIAQSQAQAKAMWRLREEAPEAQKFEGGSIKHDISVPVGKVPMFLARATQAVEAHLPGIRVAAFGHAGDGNIHYNLSQPVGADRAAYLARWDELNRIVHDIVQDLGGSFSAEHGIGRLKRAELAHYKSPIELATMRAIKAALDPHNIMNPGKVIDP